MRPVHQKKFSWEEENILRRHRSTMLSTVFLTILCCYVVAGLPLENKVNSNNNVRKFLEIQERLSKEKSESAPEPEPTPTSSSKDNDTVSAKDISITDRKFFVNFFSQHFSGVLSLGTQLGLTLL